ncbi:DUF6502 family protein [Ideonella oryzae]|uniref:DUF6502 family protein n=1 Tax=Ideonella oryzae TaxID=2937441 RepID=A0ABT1BJP2_9BURK|nr:DUF6502 family protein [Ideonella oryzae]MCO5976416.1 DUF6502 family protein [Ideonella oryzae]
MSTPEPTDLPEHDALLQVAQSVLLPLARLLVARGVHFAAVEEQLKQAFVAAAREAALVATPDALPHRLVSRLSTATGINRREVTRLVHAEPRVASPRRSLAAEVYSHWLTNPVYRDMDGSPSVLPRQGARPSFETLAREITSDVHPRSLLDDMVRLGFAELSGEGDRVQAVPNAFVPRGDAVRAYQILGSNVGDHLRGAVTNVLGDGRQHFDQAIVADGLSDESIQTVRKLIVAQWRSLFDQMVPALERLIEEDKALPTEAARQRLLLGLYSFNEPEPPAQAGGETDEQPT